MTTSKIVFGFWLKAKSSPTKLNSNNIQSWEYNNTFSR